MLLRTIHGSRLYGLAHADSDIDIYEVHASGSLRKRGANGVDTTTTGLSDFVAQCDRGVPEALETMFSPLAEPSVLDTYRSAYRVSTGEVATRYRHAIVKHLTVPDPTTFKRRRHALRMTVNLADALAYGRFNPVLTPERAEEITLAANGDWRAWLDENSPIDLEL